jgi:hypothetical protein
MYDATLSTCQISTNALLTGSPAARSSVPKDA